MLGILGPVILRYSPGFECVEDNVTASGKLPSPLSLRMSDAVGFLPCPCKAFGFFWPSSYLVWSVEMLLSHMKERWVDCLKGFLFSVWILTDVKDPSRIWQLWTCKKTEFSMARFASILKQIGIKSLRDQFKKYEIKTNFFSPRGKATLTPGLLKASFSLIKWNIEEDRWEKGKKKANTEMIFYLVDLPGSAFFLEVCISQVLLLFLLFRSSKVKKNQISKSH